MDCDSKILPCEILNQLKKDLVTIAKSTITDFDATYEFAPNAVLSIHLDKRPSGEFHVQVKSPYGEETVVQSNHKNMIPLVVGFCWKAVCQILVKNNLDNCTRTNHGGADEILALHKSIRDFSKNKNAIPYSSSDIFPSEGYELMHVQLENGRCLMTIATKHVHGNPIKSIVDVQNPDQIPQRGRSLVDDLLGSWLRPSTVKTFKTAASVVNRQRSTQMHQLSDHIIF